ncbi:MAG: hypothetical protein DELT_01531 [Desulfovibrio sp.]
MARYLLVFLQGAALALGALFVSVLAVAPFTEYGVLTAPGKVKTGIVLMRLMPVESVTFMNMLPDLFWAPITTAVLALPQGIGLLRHLRWIGVAVNLAVLGYVYYAFPGLGAPQNMPLPLVLTAALFAISAVLLIIMPKKPVPSARASSFAVFLTLLLWLATVGLLIYGAALNSLPLQALAGVAVSCVVLTVAFYCLVKAIQVPDSKSGSSVGAVGYLLIPLLIGIGVFFGGAIPLALPIGAGILLFFAVGMS